jgi:predicted acylesterase/phospholipase RssA
MNVPGDSTVTKRRLTPREIKYIVFEGGGGKGFAYLGALRALEKLGVLKYISPASSDVPTADNKRHSRLDFRTIKGIGGASAGAITALLLSIGYTPQELADLMSDTGKFLAFFDGGFNDPKDANIKRLRPIYQGCESVPDTAEEDNWKTYLPYAEDFAGLEAAILPPELRFLGLFPTIADTIDQIRSVLRRYRDVPPFQTLIPNWKEFVVNFPRDWGLFAGCAARQWFDKLITDRMPVPAQPQKSVTFEDHYQHFRVELLVTGTNLLTGKSEVFSHLDTPGFSVADAVRISMGIPFAFKPVIIDDSTAGVGQSKGVWVDGGLLNNVPFREFDDRPGANPKTLALRLDIEPAQPPPIKTLQEFLAKYLTLALGGPGEAYITSAHAFQTIVLDTTGLSLLDFAPQLQVRQRAERAAYMTTYNYFRGHPNTPSFTAVAQ